MVNTLKTSFGFNLAVALAGDTPVMGNAQRWTGQIEFAKSLSHGILADQANLCYFAERTIASASNDDLDLSGVLTDAFGDTLANAKLKLILILNRARDASEAANTTDLTIGGGSNPFVGILGGTAPTIGPIKPGGFVMIGASHLDGIGAVTAGTGDILRIANSSGASAKYVVGLIGAAAS